MTIDVGIRGQASVNIDMVHDGTRGTIMLLLRLLLALACDRIVR